MADPAVPRGSAAGYAAIADRLADAPASAVRGASSMPTQMFDDLPPRFASHVARLRDAVQMHVELTRRQEMEVLQAVRLARQASSASEQAAAHAAEVVAAVAVVPNLAQDLANMERRREVFETNARASVRALSRWWTAIALVGVVNIVTTMLLAAMVGYLLVHG